jgi:hypothetical protein
LVSDALGDVVAGLARVTPVTDTVRGNWPGSQWVPSLLFRSQLFVMKQPISPANQYLHNRHSKQEKLKYEEGNTHVCMGGSLFNYQVDQILVDVRI